MTPSPAPVDVFVQAGPPSGGRSSPPLGPLAVPLAAVLGAAISLRTPDGGRLEKAKTAA